MHINCLELLAATLAVKAFLKDKGSEGSVSEVTAGQSDSCSIHQQYGGNSFPAADKSLQSPVDVGTIQRHCADRRIYSGVHETQSPEP